jgi:hypothetical protein
MARITYANKLYEAITREEMGESIDYQISSFERNPSLEGVRLTLPLVFCAEEPEMEVPLIFPNALGAQMDIIAPDRTPRGRVPAAGF